MNYLTYLSGAIKALNPLAALLVLAALVSCSKDGPSEDGPEDQPNGSVYIAGYVRNGIRLEPALWENGELTALPFNSGSNTRAIDIAVEGKDTYVLGQERSPNSFSRVSTIVLWKNKEMQVITDGTKRAEALKLAVDKGNVYILGTETDQSAGSATAIYKYWKNGVPTTLNTKDASAMDMVVRNNDVYIAGDEKGASNRRVATYWKNGIPVALTDGTKDATATAIDVQGTDIAALVQESTGELFGNALSVWKNGKVTTLRSGNVLSSGRAITLENGVVHALNTERDGASSGFGSEKVMYWKDNVKTAITDGAALAEATALVIRSGQAYIAFHENNSERNPVAKSAKGGVVKVLSKLPDESMTTTGLWVNGADEYVIGNSGHRAYVWKNGEETVIAHNGYAAAIAMAGNGN